MSANVPANTIASVPESLSTSSGLPAVISWVGMVARAVNYLLGVCKLIYNSSTAQLTFNNDVGNLPSIRSDVWDDTEYFVKLGQSRTKGGTLAVISAGAPSGLILERCNGTYASPTALLSGDPLGTYTMGGSDGTGTTLLNGVGGMIMWAGENWSGTQSGSYLTLSTQENGTHRASAPERRRVYLRKGLEICDGAGAEPTGGDKGAGTLNVATGYYVNGSRGATYQAQPADPTGTTSLTGVMMGLAGSITPKTTGTVVIIISGIALNNTNGDGFKVQIRFGTGSAPANGAALTGSTAGAEQGVILPTANDGVIFSCNALLTGGSVGTTYWIDVDLMAVTGGTASIQRVSITAFELTV